MSLPLSNESVRTTHAELIGVAGSPRAYAAHNGLPRSVDAVAAFCGLLVAVPVIAVCALAIALSDSGPIFFCQKRVGQGGRLFNLYKLRTMKPSQVGPQVTSSSDERITGLGRFLRRTKLDELPTLWNVLRGDMALVGPRPEVPRYVKADDPVWQAVLSARPGITDPVTVKLRSEEELLAGITTNAESYYVTELLPLKLNGYVAYLERRDWRSDIRVLAHTIAVVIAPRSETRE
jgi:lipopolysaccharide/colanic/teichoic acid biosynthesis glycosyltransferase